MDDNKKPPFNPNQSFETVGTAADAKTTPAQEEKPKPKFNAEKPFEPVNETVKKKDTTLVSQETGGSDSETPAPQPGKPSEKNIKGGILERRTELLNKVAKAEYDDWISKKTTEFTEVVKKDPSKKDQVIAQFEKENQDKIADINKTFGKFGKIYEDQYKEKYSGILGPIKAAWDELDQARHTIRTEPLKQNHISNAFLRGMNLGSTAEIISAFKTEKPSEEKLKEVARLQKETQELPASPAYTKFNSAPTAFESVKALAEHPTQIIGELTVESLASLVNYGASRMAVGAAMGSVVPGVGTGGGVIAGLADTSLALEYAGSFLQSLQQAGVDTNDPDQLKNAFENDDLISEARSHAYKKGIPIAIFDLISGSIAGKIVTKPAKSLLGKFAQGAAEFGVQALAGGTGEASGEIISGEKVDPSAIIAEMIGELGTTPIEVSANLLGRVTPPPVSESNITAPEGILGKPPIEKTPEATIKEQTDVKSTDAKSLENSAEVIQSKVEQHETPIVEKGLEQPGTGKLPEVAAQENIQTEAPKEDAAKTEIARIIDEFDTSGEEFSTIEDVIDGIESNIENVPPIIQDAISKYRLQEKENIEEWGGRGDSEQAQSDLLNTINQYTKPTEDAIRESSATSVLQHPQEGVGEKGSERGGVEQGIEGAQVAKEETKSGPDQQGEVRQTALGARIEEFEKTPEIRERVKKADEYVRRKIDLTDQEAKELLTQWNDNEHAERVIRDKTFDLKPGVRATLAANLYQDYKAQAEATTDQAQKNQFHEKAADIGIWAAQNLTKHGQETAIAGKIWKAILQDEDISTIALERENLQVAKKLIKPIQQQVTQSKEQFDDQVRKLIEQKVTEGVESRLKKAKLITRQKKQEITDFFDSLKVADIKPGELNDISRVIGVNAWNGGIEAVKRAVLTGADLANAIQAGVDYIKENYKGKDFDEAAYIKMITPSVEKIMPKETIAATDIDETKIETPGIKGKKKKDFINSVVEAHNEGTLTDEKFEELYAKKIGYKPYTSEEKSKIRELSKIISESEKFKANGRAEWNKLNERMKAAEESGNVEEQTKIRNEFETLLDKDSKLLKEAQVANKKMQEFARAPSDVYDTLITIIQGNLLTPLSLVTNVYSNTLLQPLRFGSTAIGSVLDRSMSELAKLGLLGASYKDRTIDMVAQTKGYMTGGWKGAIEGVMQLKYGSLADEKALREIQAGFSPSRAIGRWAESDRTVKQKVNDYIEGTFGVPAEVMFRLLNLGDKPFKRGAEMARAYEIGTLKGLTGNDLIGFIAFPDEQSQAEITKAGQEATFQQESKVSQGVQKGIQWFLDLTAQVPYIGGALKVVVKSQVPYVKTPLNIAIETVDYAVPPLTLARGIHAYSTGNRRQGNILIGKAIVGGMIIAGTRQLFALGLLESDDDDKEKTSKRKEGRDLKYETVPPNSLNISALMRGLTLRGFQAKDGDISVTFKKMGPMGILMDIHAKDMYNELKEEGKVDNSAGELFLDMFSTAPRVASSALDQSFLRGTNSFLSAIQDAGGYNTEQWLINTMNSVTSVVIPNTIAAVSNAADEFKRDTYDKDFGERLKNTYMTKVFLGGGVPPKINLWGEKITGSPEGRNKFMYSLFDVTKFQATSTDDFKYKLYKQWKDDAYNDDWLPTMPKRSISVNGTNIPLSGSDYALLCEYVGKARYSMASSVIKSSMPKELKLPELKDLYSEGLSIGKQRFLLEKGWKSLSRKALKDLSEK
jgi:hypothetical protein